MKRAFRKLPGGASLLFLGVFLRADDDDAVDVAIEMESKPIPLPSVPLPSDGRGKSDAKREVMRLIIQEAGHSKLGGGSGVPCGQRLKFSSRMEPQTRSKNPGGQPDASDGPLAPVF